MKAVGQKIGVELDGIGFENDNYCATSKGEEAGLQDEGKVRTVHREGEDST